MFEVTKSVYYKEKRNFENGKVEDSANGKVVNIHTPGCSDDDMESLVSLVAEHHKITAADLIIGKVSAKVIDSSIVVKLYENEKGDPVSDEEIGDWHSGKMDVFLGCYKHDVQQVKRSDVDLGSMFSGIE